VWVCGVSLFDFFFLLGVIVLGGGFLPPGFSYICVCVARTRRYNGTLEATPHPEDVNPEEEREEVKLTPQTHQPPSNPT